MRGGIYGPGEPLQSSQEGRGRIGKYDTKFLFFFPVDRLSVALDSKQSDQTNPYTFLTKVLKSFSGLNRTVSQC